LQTKEENGISVGVQTELEELDKPADTSNGKKASYFFMGTLSFFLYFFQL
jgi:hypothetical protein